MTGQSLKEFVEELVDDSLTDEAFLALVNNAKVKLEDEGGRDWQILQLFETQSASNAAKTLPTGYIRTKQMYVNNQPYTQIPFSQKPLFANSALRWYLDIRNGLYYLLGTNITGTINHCYLKVTDDITLADEIATWPSRFHRVFGFEAAKLFYAIDQQDRVRSWDDKWNVEYQLLKNAMIDWDAALERRANENAMPPDFDAEVDLSNM